MVLCAIYSQARQRFEVWQLIAFCFLLFLGISTLSLYLELGSYTTMMMYNYCHGYAFLSYLEYPVLLVQEYILIFLVVKYKNLLGNNAYAIAGGYAVAVLAFGYNILPKFLLALIVVSTIRILVTGLLLNYLFTFKTPGNYKIVVVGYYIQAGMH